MKRRNTIFLLISILFLNSSLFAQTRVVKTTAAKSNDFGVEYFLPKTVLDIEVGYSKVTEKAGEYARYAGKLLGLNEADIVLEDQTYYVLNSVSAKGIGIPDRDASYLIEFKSKTTAPFVYLTEDGLICTINTEYTPEFSKKEDPTTNVLEDGSNTLNPQSLFTEEYLRAGSVAKMAEVLAKQIYRIRESRNDILLGNAENAPRDGEGMRIVLENLDAQEKALMELFTGTTSTKEEKTSFEVEPQSDITKEILFRFSKYHGVVDSDDLSGSPVYINVTALNPVIPQIPDPAKKGKEALSIVYTIPVKSSVEIFYGTKKIYDEEIQIAQFGEKRTLATSFFDDKKAPVKVYFYPETGAIKQIIQ